VAPIKTKKPAAAKAAPAPAPAPAAKAQPAKPQQQQQQQASSTKSKPQQQQQSLLDFDGDAETSPADSQPSKDQYASLAGDLGNLALTPTLVSPSPAKAAAEESEEDVVQQVKLPTIKFKPTQLLSHLTGRGLAVECFYGRRPSFFPDRMVSVQLLLTNRGQKPISNITASTEGLEKGAELIPFNPVSELAPEDTVEVNLNIDFNQKTTPISFTIS